MHRVIPFILLLFALPVFTQPLQKYQGKLANGFTEPGDVTYSYRPDEKTREHIRHGTFRYAVKAKDDQFRFNHNISGTYKDNLKEGIWSYKINQKDFVLQHPKLYTTGTASLDAAYRAGVPHGPWRYESALKSRSGEKMQDKWTWGKHDSLQTVIIEMNFTDGAITGPFYARNDRLYEARGAFDDKGFFHGEWTWRFPDSIVTIQWEHGLELKFEITDPEGAVLHLEQNQHAVSVIREYQRITRQSEAQKIKESPFSLDTVSLLSVPDYHLTALFHSTILNPSYCLYKEIEGDKGFFYDRNTYRMRTGIKGMYTIRPKNKISSTQVQHYTRMETLLKRMEAQLAYIYQMRRDGKLKKQASEAIRLMEFNITLARRHACTGETLKLYLSLQDGLDAAEASCAYHAATMEKMPRFSTKEEALQYMINKITELEKGNQTHYTNIRKNMAN